MVSLPAEVLLSIFPYLVQRDLLECMTVCKPWRNVIQHHSLFRNVYIEDHKHLTKLIRRVIRDPTLGARVHHLTINSEIENGFDEVILADLFPNVREFRLINQDLNDPNDESYDIHPNHPWCDRIEKLADGLPFNNTNALLNSGLCKRLTHLSLWGRYNFPNIKDFFALLVNTPALTTLELRDFHVTWRRLELLHSVVPTLRSILLKECLVDGASLPLNIEPATSVKSFRHSNFDVDTFSEQEQYMTYIAEKYTHLEDLALEIYPFDSYIEEDAEPEERQKTILVSYLTKLGTRLKSLSLYVSGMGEEYSASFDYKMLDDCGCKIEHLELGHASFMFTLELLSRTNQAKYIQSLTVTHMDYNPKSTDNTISLRWLSRFKSLKELSLNFPSRSLRSKKKHVLNLPELLDPLTETQVQTLQIKNVEVCVKMGDTPRIYPLVKNLFLDDVEFNLHSDIYMAEVLPNLKNLTLSSCLKDRTLFSFPNLELSRLRILEMMRSKPLQVLVSTLGDDQKRMYTVKNNPVLIGFDEKLERKDMFSLPPVTSKPYNETADFPLATIVCKSLCQFFMVKY